MKTTQEILQKAHAEAVLTPPATEQKNRALAAMADALMRGATLVEACQAGTRAGALKAQEEPF